MFMGEELMRGIEQYGRWNMQEFVARSQEVMDVLAYLRAERVLEMFKVTSFVTADSCHFSKRTDSPASPNAFGGISQYKMEDI
jgi:hypothetical protein